MSRLVRQCGDHPLHGLQHTRKIELAGVLGRLIETIVPDVLGVVGVLNVNIDGDRTRSGVMNDNGRSRGQGFEWTPNQSAVPRSRASHE